MAARFRFVHDLIRETLDTNLGATHRAQLHRCAGDAILRTRRSSLEDHYVALARHYLESAAFGTAREAVHYAVCGAELAASSYSYEFAVKLFRQALRALELLAAQEEHSDEALAQRGDILIRIGDELWHSGRREEAVESDRAAEQLARRLDDPTLLARAAIGLSGRNDLPMDLPDAQIRLLEEALEKLPESDSRLRVRLLAHLVRATYFGENRDQLRRWADGANAIAKRLDDPGALFAAQESLHYALVMPAHLEERLVVSERLPALARRTGSQRREALASLWRIFDLILVPDIQATDAAIAKFEEVAGRLRQPFFEWLAIGIRATRAQMTGHLDEIERLVFQALEVGERAHTPNATLFFGTQLFHLRAEQGRCDELLPIMQKIVDERPGLPVFRIGIPLIHALADREEEARRTFEQVATHDFRDIPRDLHRLSMLCSAAAVAAYLGDARRAEVLRDELREDAGRIVMSGVVTYWEGAVDRALGYLEETLGRFEEAERYYAVAARIAERACAGLLEAHALTERARVLRRLATAASRESADRLEQHARGLYRERGIQRPSMIVPAVARTGAGGRSSAIAAAPTAGAFCREGLKWRLSYEDVQVELPDTKGLAYLQRLIATPDEAVHVLDLVAMEGRAAPEIPSEQGRSRSTDGPARMVESSIEALDHKARRAYQDRLRELAGRREEAEGDRDLAILVVDSQPRSDEPIPCGVAAACRRRAVRRGFPRFARAVRCGGSDALPCCRTKSDACVRRSRLGGRRGGPGLRSRYRSRQSGGRGPRTRNPRVGARPAIRPSRSRSALSAASRSNSVLLGRIFTVRSGRPHPVLGDSTESERFASYAKGDAPLSRYVRPGGDHALAHFVHGLHADGPSGHGSGGLGPDRDRRLAVSAGARLALLRLAPPDAGQDLRVLRQWSPDTRVAIGSGETIGRRGIPGRRRDP